MQNFQNKVRISGMLLKYEKAGRDLQKFFLSLNFYEWQEMVMYLFLAEDSDKAPVLKESGLTRLPLFYGSPRDTQGPVSDTILFIGRLEDPKIRSTIARAINVCLRIVSRSGDNDLLKSVLDSWLITGSSGFGCEMSTLTALMERVDLPIPVRTEVLHTIRQVTTQYNRLPSKYFVEKVKEAPEFFIPCHYTLMRQEDYFSVLYILKYLDAWPTERTFLYMFEKNLVQAINSSASKQKIFCVATEGAACGWQSYVGILSYIMDRLRFELKPEVQMRLLQLISERQISRTIWEENRSTINDKIGVYAETKAVLEAELEK